MITTTEGKNKGLSRRQALARLGLTATVVYAAPTITRLDQARALVPSHGCPPRHPLCGSDVGPRTGRRDRDDDRGKRSRRRGKRDD